MVCDSIDANFSPATGIGKALVTRPIADLGKLFVFEWLTTFKR
jgi:hypothetical protein